MRSREDLVGMMRQAQKHPKADLLFEIGLEEPTPTKAAQRAHESGLSNEEEKLAKWIAVFKRDYGKGWFGALRGIFENTETENAEMGLTKTQRRILDTLKREDIQEALDILTIRATGKGLTTLLQAIIPPKPAFDPQKVKEEHLRSVCFGYHPVVPFSEKIYGELCEGLFGMDYKTTLDHIPDPEPGHENYLLVVNCLSLAKLMRFVIVDGKRGKCLLNENDVEDIVEVPKTLFYWRYDIDNGDLTLGKTPDLARKLLKDKKRQELTARELVCLVIAMPNICECDCGVWACGSRHGDDKVVGLWLERSGPALNWWRSWFGSRYSIPERGLASCLR